MFLTLFRLLNKKQPHDTYAQYNEDRIVQALIGPVHRYIDIGANDGYTASNTHLFARQGASGLLFEPDPTTLRSLRRRYCVHPHVKIIPQAVSNEEQHVTLVSNGLLSTVLLGEQDQGLEKLLQPFKDPNARQHTVKTTTLQAVLQDNPSFREVDLLSIDVEGHEKNVLEGIDFNHFMTKAILVETHSRSGNSYEWLHQHSDFINAYLHDAGYTLLGETACNRLWLRNDVLATTTLQELQPQLQALGFTFSASASPAPKARAAG